PPMGGIGAGSGSIGIGAGAAGLAFGADFFFAAFFFFATAFLDFFAATFFFFFAGAAFFAFRFFVFAFAFFAIIVLQTVSVRLIPTASQHWHATLMPLRTSSHCRLGSPGQRSGTAFAFERCGLRSTGRPVDELDWMDHRDGRACRDLCDA